MLSTIEGSGASSSASADGQMSVTASGDEWLPTDETTASTAAATELDGPTITFQSAAGHEFVLTYQDIVLLALLAGASAAAWRGMQ